LLIQFKHDIEITLEVQTSLASLLSYLHAFCPDFLKNFKTAMAKKYCFYESEISASFEDVINIIIQLDSFKYMANIILIVIIERFFGYIKNVYFKLNYITFKLLNNLFLVKYLKTLGC
jgi:hypothetical protein